MEMRAGYSLTLQTCLILSENIQFFYLALNVINYYERSVTFMIIFIINLLLIQTFNTKENDTLIFKKDTA